MAKKHYGRYCIRQVGTQKFLGTMAIIGGKMVSAFTDHADDAINTETQERARMISTLCNAGGCDTYVYPWSRPKSPDPALRSLTTSKLST